MDKTDGQQLFEELSYKKKSSYERFPEQTEAAKKYCMGYSEFLDECKTEREAVAYAVKKAEAHGFEKFDFGMPVKLGGKYYYNNRNKNLFMFVIGKNGLNNGIAIEASHIDSPRIDIKANPLYEADGMAFFKTHYYGGIKKYQWTAIPLALHGIVVKRNGKTVDIKIGEDENDPIFYINDILPHLGKDQYKKTLGESIEGEQLNLLVGCEEYNDESVDEKIKLNVLNILNEKYGITEEDLLSAELSAVPAFKCRDVGFDRGLIASYGHDDRVCAYPMLDAILNVDEPERTVMAVFADKEETGSNGNTGLKTSVMCDIISDLCDTLGNNERTVRARSMCLSADVAAGYDPNFAYAYEKRNSAILNSGIAVCKFTGSRGKSDTNDANAEYVGKIRKIFDSSDIVWQMCEMGKVDQGGGGTVAKYVSEKNIDTIDVGVAVISMHAPYEVVAKNDVYNMYKACLEFFKYTDNEL